MIPRPFFWLIIQQWNVLSGAGMSGKRLKIVIVLVLCILTGAVFARTAWYPFSCNDDPDYVTQNVHVLAGLSFDSIRWAFSSFYAANWHPLTWLSLMLDAQIWGLNPMGYHIFNVALHVANTALLFYLFAFMTGSVWRSAFVAALFALHPQHVESVVWITERKDVLSTFFWLMTLFLYAAYTKNSSRRLYFLSVTTYAFGLMAKPMLVTLPVILLVIDYWPLGRLEPPSCAGAFWENIKTLLKKRIVTEKIPFFLLSAGMSIVTIYAQRQALADVTVVPINVRIANALWSTSLYAMKMIYPLNLAAFYPFVPVPLWKTMCAVILLGGTVYLAFRTRHRLPYLTAGVAWYLVTLLPVIGLIQVGSQAMADRYTYIPCIGLFAALCWGVWDLAIRFPRRKSLICATAGTILSAYLVCTFLQIGYWQDDNTLYSHSIAITEDYPLAHNVMAIAYEKNGQAELAVKEYDRALALDPNDAGIHRNLGIVLYKRLGKSAEAVRQLQIADRLRPNNALTHYHMAKAYVGMGRMEEAVAEYQKALAITPNDPYFHNDLGMALLQLNMTDEAIKHINEALRLLPHSAKRLPTCNLR